VIRACVASITALLVGCAHTDVVRTRPGEIDPRTPPQAIAQEVHERPNDPGERILVFSPGVFGGVGLSMDDPRSSGSAYSLGAEASIHYGSSDTSHAEDTFFVYPSPAFGLNAGYTLTSQDRAGPSVGYLEAQYFDAPFGAAAGWAWDPSRALHGPQTTIFAGPLYARATHFLGDRTELTVGLCVKLPYVWIWAR
jgi:hypothetical protein